MKGMELKTDEQLMTEYQCGNESAFEEIYNRHIESLTSYIISQCSQTLRNNIDDIIQDVFLDFHEQRDKFPGGNMKVKPWLKAIAYHKIISYLRFEMAKCRTKEGTVSSDSCSSSSSSNPVTEAIYREMLNQFKAWLKTKPENWRTMLESGTAEKVAEKTGVPVTSVRHFTREGLSKVKELCA